MTELLVSVNKKLVLKNVITYEIRDISLNELEEKIDFFLANINALRVETFGPLITKNYGTQIQDDGSLTTSYDIMVQAYNYKNFKHLYKVRENVSAEHCVYVRFEDHPQYANYAHAKLDLYFYENDLVSEGITYMVIINDSQEHLIMDLFQPVKSL